MKKALFALAGMSLMAAPIAANASVRPMTAVPMTSSSTAIVGADNSDKSNDRAFVLAAMIGALALFALVVFDNSNEDDVDVLPLPVSGG